MIATADFETTTNEEDCRVWAFGICEIGNYDNFIYGNNLDDFFKICEDKYENHTFYFHNLKFDGEFIIYWLERHGFKEVKNRKAFKDKTFITLISDKNQFYSIEICFKQKGHKTNKVTIYDSLKILNFSVAQIAKDFNTGLKKLEMEEGYEGFREVGHKLTIDEIKYLRNDVEIVARALNYLFNEKKMLKMTIGADALFSYKEIVGARFKKNFPTPSIEFDDYIRKSYKGGFTYLNDKYKGKIVGSGIVLDVNSLYPSVMYDCPMPHGEGLYYEGKYESDKLYNLYVQKICCQFELKKGYIPTIQIKGDTDFVGTEYLKNSGDKEVVLTLTSVDLELFLEHYDVYNLEYIDGYKFKSSTGLFKEYIDIWMAEKINGKLHKNKAMEKTAKLMLNSLYGKFSLSPLVRGKHVLYDEENDEVIYKIGRYDENGEFVAYGKEEYDIREPIYIPAGSFITAWARNKTIRSAQKVYDRFIYADTDSLHLEGLEIPDELEIHDTKLGAWKWELVFDKAKYLRAKSYMEYGKEPHEDDSEKAWKITCAGMPVTSYDYVLMKKFETDKLKYKRYKVKISKFGLNKINISYSDLCLYNFDIGKSYKGKLQQKRVKGGIILKETEFTINEKLFMMYR